MWGGDYGGNRYFSKLFLLIKTYQYNFFSVVAAHQFNIQGRPETAFLLPNFLWLVYVILMPLYLTPLGVSSHRFTSGTLQTHS